MNPLKTWLEENHKTQYWLAKEIGESKQYVNNIVNDKRFPSLKIQIKIREVTNIHKYVWLDYKRNKLMTS